MSVYVREAEVRVLKAAAALAEAGKNNEMPSRIVHEVCDAVRELDEVMKNRSAQLAFDSWYENVYIAIHGGQQQYVQGCMREAFVAGWNAKV